MEEKLNLDDEEHLESFLKRFQGSHFEDIMFEADVSLTDAIALKSYAREKKAAIKFRKNGEIHLALLCEQECEILYGCLSKEAKW